MRGKVLSVASAAEMGIISGDDGIRYPYNPTTLRCAALSVGQEVNFEVDGAMAQSVHAVVGSGTRARPGLSGLERNWVRFYASPSGRITRRDYWIYGVLVILALNLLLGWIPILGWILALSTLWPSIALAFKRLHDRSMPGWWIFVPYVPAILGTGLLMASIAGANGSPDLNVPLASLGGGLLLIGLGASLWIIFGVLARRGAVGPNEYGPDPLQAQI